MDLAGSIASTVYLDRAAGTATKVYRPSRPVRALYWAAFQAPFPYARQIEALHAAARIREFTGLLTRYWTGEDMIAGVREVRRTRNGELAFVTELVEGEEPANNAEVADELRALRRRFAGPGLPTWQINPENPHAHTNFIRSADGRLKLIDIESTLIRLIQPLRSWPYMLRSGRLPAFDDVDFATLHAYVDKHSHDLRAVLGAADFARLEHAVDEAERHSNAWKSRERAIWGVTARRFWSKLAWDRRTGPIRDRIGRAEEFALGYIAKPLDRWVDQGHISHGEAKAVRGAMNDDTHAAPCGRSAWPSSSPSPCASPSAA